MQFKQAEDTANKLDLDGLVVIGGDDSNTNACLLAEYFRLASNTVIKCFFYTIVVLFCCFDIITRSDDLLITLRYNPLFFGPYCCFSASP